MKKILCIVLTILFAANVSLTVDARTLKTRTIKLKKHSRLPKDNDRHKYGSPSVLFTCEVEKDSGIQPIDTSEIETFEVWDCTDTAPIVIYDDEKLFVDYILNDSAEGIIKLFTPDYIYIGNLEPQFEMQ